MKKLLLALHLCILAAAPVVAKSVDFPTNDPVFSFTLPDKWTGTPDGNVYNCEPKGDKNFAFSIFPAPAASSVEDVITATQKSAESQYTEVKLGDSSTHEMGGTKFLFSEGTGKQGDATLKLTIVGFSPDGQHYFGIFAAGTEAADKAHGGECVELLQSIKAKKGDAKEKED